jgi:hypothetical protein
MIYATPTRLRFGEPFSLFALEFVESLHGVLPGLVPVPGRATATVRNGVRFDC